ncbi:MAG: methyltransferase domain-containing protein [Bdellovibrionales bacterium]|nr:methyltransferase domain-containing protein [Bdellovibrionales bacterium]
MSNKDWSDYYDKWRGQPANELLLKVLEEYAPTSDSSTALDLGSGTGRDSFELLGRGWLVLAIDSQELAIKIIKQDVPEDVRGRLSAIAGSFVEVPFPQCLLVNASMSLFFCDRTDFSIVWGKILAALLPGGIFVGNFLGINDDWSGEEGFSSHTQDELRELLAPMEILDFEENEFDGHRANGEPKHWHLFSVIARIPIRLNQQS